MADSMESFDGDSALRDPFLLRAFACAIFAAPLRDVRTRFAAAEADVRDLRALSLPATDRTAIACFMDRLFVGTSGWIYKSWGGSFYPSGQGRVDHLEFYAGHFRSVEINASFYRLQQPEVVRGWYRRSPSGFRFAVKGSRFITHMKRLNVEPHSIKVFFDR